MPWQGLRRQAFIRVIVSEWIGITRYLSSSTVCLVLGLDLRQHTPTSIVHFVHQYLIPAATLSSISVAGSLTITQWSPSVIDHTYIMAIKPAHLPARLLSGSQHVLPGEKRSMERSDQLGPVLTRFAQGSSMSLSSSSKCPRTTPLRKPAP